MGAFIKSVELSILDSQSEILFSTVFECTHQTKKMVSSEAASTVLLLVERTLHSVRFLNQFHVALNDKNAFSRETGSKLVETYLKQIKTDSEKKLLFDRNQNHHEILGKCILKNVSDSNHLVRVLGRECFHHYKDLYPDHAAK